MKKRLFFTFIILFITVILVANTSYAEVKQLTFACENKQDFPTIMGDTTTIDATKPGMGVVAIKMLEKKLGVKIKIIRLPWKRCLLHLEQGKIDGVFTASFKEKRKVHGRYPEKDGKIDVNRRYSSASYSLYRLKGSNVSFNGDQFLNITGKVGAPIGYSIVDDLKKKGLNMDPGPSTAKDFAKLIKGRLQAVAALEMTGDYFLVSDNEFSEKIEKIKPNIVMKPYYFMLSHQLYAKDKVLCEKIFDTIADIREAADYKMNLKDYL